MGEAHEISAVTRSSSHAKTCGATYVTIAGDFNESEHSSKTQNFMNGTVLLDFFQVINGDDPE